MGNFDIVGIALGIFLALTVAGILVVVGFGLKNLFSGRHEWQKIAVLVLPFAIFGILLATLGGITQAGVGTLIAMIFVMVLLIVLSSIRTTFKF
jgi:hypothetical protein